MKSLRWRSIYVLYGLSLLFAFGLFDFLFTRWDWLSAYREDFALKVSRLNGEAFVARTIFRSDQSLLLDYLESRRRNGAISTWILYENSEVKSGSLPPGKARELKFRQDTDSDEIVRIDAETFYVSEPLDTETRLVLMLSYDQDLFLQKQVELGWATLLKYLVGILSLALLSFAFFFKEISRLIRRLREGSTLRPEAVELAARRALTQEAQVLGLGLAANQVDRLSVDSEREVLRRQVLPSFRRELESGLRPPYDFHCTLVRTDINNFTKIYNDPKSRSRFTSIIDSFFSETSLLVARYEGCVHQFVGDEILFYFKDQDHKNSIEIAAACVRDMNVVAERLSKRSQTDIGHAFTIKSSLAHGEMTFAPFVFGFSIAGPPLIETVRILSLVEDRENNVLVFDSRHRAQLERVADCKLWKLATLKGFVAEVEICRVNQFTKPPGVSPLLFRSDEDLEMFIRNLHFEMKGSESPAAWKEQILIYSQEINRLRLPGTSGRPAEALIELISFLMGGFPDARFLPSLLSALKHWVPEGEDWLRDRKTELLALLDQGLASGLPRLVANSIEVRSKLFSDWMIDESLLKSAHPRVRANALVALAHKNLDRAVVLLRRQMKEAVREGDKISLRWTLNKIYSDYQRINPVLISTNLEFRDLMEQYKN